MGVPMTRPMKTSIAVGVMLAALVGTHLLTPWMLLPWALITVLCVHQAWGQR